MVDLEEHSLVTSRTADDDKPIRDRDHISNAPATKFNEQKFRLLFVGKTHAENGHQIISQHWSAETDVKPAGADRKALDIQAVLLARQLRERAEQFTVCNQSSQIDLPRWQFNTRFRINLILEKHISSGAR